MKMSESKGNQQYSIPNTEAGWAEIKRLRQQLKDSGSDMRLRVFGRGPTEKGAKGYATDLPIAKSTWLAVYVRPKYCG